jgi:hypothetical protein
VTLQQDRPAWAAPKYEKAEVRKAGRSLVDPAVSPDQLEMALRIIDNWRASHAFPLNTFQVTLRRKAYEVDKECLVAQRLKRLSSIQDKLRRLPTMNLPQMQDIGGCRAVVSNVARVDELCRVYKDSDLKHQLLRRDDYIRGPKKSGYRGVHFIYRYFSPKKETYNGLQIEIQFRSKLQHAWATSVETVDTFLKQALKASQGDERWLRFFALMGSAIAHRERTPLVPDTPAEKGELLQELRKLARELEVARNLESFSAVLRIEEEQASLPGTRYYLLVLQPKEQTLNVSGYQAGELEKATDAYLEMERSLAGQPGAAAVLVAAESLVALRRAFPNFYLDTHVFLDAMRAAIDP